MKKVLSGTEKTVALLSSANVINSAVSIVSGLIVARWLLPEDLGSFNALSIFTSYILLTQLGIPSGLSRDLPFYYGKKDDDYAKELAATSKAFMLTLSLIVLSACIALSLFFFTEGEYQYSVGCIVIGATSFQGLYVTKYLKILYRADNHFKKLAKIKMIDALVNAVSIFLVYKFLFYGLCIRSVLVVLVDWYFTAKWKPLQVKAQWSFANFKSLTKVGMPIYFVANIYGLWPTFQRTAILAYLGTSGLGLYALSTIVQNVLNNFSSSMNSVSFPKMSKAYGAGLSFIEVLKMPLRLVVISLAINLLALVIGWPLMPYIVQFGLPKYVEGVEAAQWMLLVGVVSSWMIFSNVFMVIKKNHLRLISYLLGMLVWYSYLFFSKIGGIEDLTIFNKALFWGMLTVAVSDTVMYVFIWKGQQIVRTGGDHIVPGTK